MKNLFVQNNFYPQARTLRAEYDRRFQDPKAARADRFVWDYWHVPEQYTLLRTPAASFFSPAEFERFTQYLLEWGQRNLGCSGISPPWLSAYVEGCEQKLHSDVPHGPWAYVFSLSPRRPLFTGGETMLLTDEVLDYWPHFSDAKDREQSSFLRRIKPAHNRLVVFDPRIPHGVTPVRGVHDVREARLVVHGWFTEPRPFLEGALSARAAAPVLDQFVEDFVRLIDGRCHGTLVLEMKVAKKGNLRSVRALTNTIQALDKKSVGALPGIAMKLARALKFPAKQGETKIVLPLLFR